MFNFLRNKNYNYIAQKFNDIGIYLDKNSYLDLKDIVWEEILFVLNDLMNIYPIIPIGFLSEINTKKYDNIASIGFIKSDDNINYDVSKGLQLRLNTFYFSNKKNFENNIYDSNLAWKRFDGSILTNDDYIKVGISHEFGHTIDVYKTISYLGLYNVKLSENKAKAFFKHINYSQSIIPNEIYKLYPKKILKIFRLNPN